ncbi:hypothetical protein D3C86_1545080 [compost metagenome]
MRLSTIAVKPWAVYPPWIMCIIPEQVPAIGQFRNSGHIAHQLHTEVPIQSCPWRIWWGQQVKAAFVNSPQVYPVPGQVGTCRKIGPPGLYLKFRAFCTKELPKIEIFSLHFCQFPCVKCFAVKYGPFRRPCFHPKAKTIA